MNPVDDRKQQLTRRSFLSLSSTCLGAAALNSLLAEESFAQSGQAFGGITGSVSYTHLTLPTPPYV